jgi:hypothetical protein
VPRAVCRRRAARQARNPGSGRCTRSQRGKAPDDESGEQRDQYRDAEDGPVDAHLRESGDVDGASERAKGHDGCRSHEEPQRAGQDGHEKPLAEELHEDDERRRAERSLERESVPASLGQNEKEVKNVRPGDGQNESRSPEDHPQQAPDVSDDDVSERTHRRAHARLFDRFGGQPSGDFLRQSQQKRLELAFRFVGGHAVAQPSDALVVERRGLRLRRIQAQGKPQLRVRRRETNTGRQDAGDLVGHAVDLEPTIQDARIPAVLPPPEPFGDEHDGRGTRSIVRLGEETAAKRGDSQGREQVEGDAARGHALGIGAAHGAEPGGGDLVAAQVGEGALISAIEQKTRVGLLDSKASAHDERMGQRNESLRLGIGKRAQQHSVDDGEDGRDSGDPESERQ